MVTAPPHLIMSYNDVAQVKELMDLVDILYSVSYGISWTGKTRLGDSFIISLSESMASNSVNSRDTNRKYLASRVTKTALIYRRD